MIVLVVSCCLAIFRGQPDDSGKRGTYIRKRFEKMKDRDRDREADKEETNRKVNSRFPKSWSDAQVENRNTSEAIGRRALIGWKKLKR